MNRPPLSVLALVVLSMLTVSGEAIAQPSEPEAPPPIEPWIEDPLAHTPEPIYPDFEDLLAPYLAELEAISAAEATEAEPDTVPPDSLPDPLRLREDHLTRAATEFDREGQAPVVALPTGQVHPFGHEIPEIVCLPARACDLELEAGETIDGLVVGDPERWSSEFLFEGTAKAPIPHIVLKPVSHDLRTNAVVVTSRRTYHLELVSPPETEAEPTPYHHHVSWWYPGDWVRRARAETARVQAQAAQAPPSPIDRPLDLGSLDFSYRIEEPRRTRHRLGWRPVTVFDDGTRTYLRLPPEAHRSDLPAVLGRLADGSLYPLESRLAGGWLVVAQVADRLELVVGSGKSRRSLTLVALGRSR